MHRDPATGRLILTRYPDVVAALKHPQLSSREVLAPVMNTPKALRPLVQPAVRVFSRMMLFTDLPDHTRLRSLAARAFTPRAVDGMRQTVQHLADGLLDRMDPSRPVDLLTSYANWLPVMVIAEMLGATVDCRRIKRWSDDWVLLISGSSLPAPVVAFRGAASGFCLERYMRRLVRHRRAHPGEALLDTLIAAEESGDALTQEELVSNAILLLAAGHITTTNLIGNGMLALLQHPDQLELLRKDPSLIASAVEEILRFESPLQFSGRVAVGDLELNGHHIASGSTVALCIGGANRDPEQFPSPDRLDITRTENRHLAFSAGPHFCLGAALARLEGQIAIAALIQRFPRLRLADGPIQWRNAGTIRALAQLPVLLR